LSGLADIALLWMVEQVEAAGLKFDRGYLRELARALKPAADLP